MRPSARVEPVRNEQTRESLAILNLLAQGQRSIENGRQKPLKKAFADLTARTKNLP
jgi:hypothetical protein